MKLSTSKPSHPVEYPEVAPEVIGRQLDIRLRAATAKPPLPFAGTLDVNEEAVVGLYRRRVVEGNQRTTEALDAAAVSESQLSATLANNCSNAGSLT